jgi:uncharacterized SAM-binding protein YcdF (DUF218 family)
MSPLSALHSMKRLFVLLLVLIVIAALLFLQPGGYLIVNHPEKSDAIVVLAGEQIDARYWRALGLLRAGYGQHLVMDVGDGSILGHPLMSLAQEFVANTAGNNRAQISICPVSGDSTKDEAPQIDACLQKLQPAPHSVVVVTDDYHTRRALSILENRAPQYAWTAAAATNDFMFGLPWWKHREWAKTYLTEWEKLLFWQLWDRWRK